MILPSARINSPQVPRSCLPGLPGDYPVKGGGIIRSASCGTTWQEETRWPPPGRQRTLMGCGQRRRRRLDRPSHNLGQEPAQIGRPESANHGSNRNKSKSFQASGAARAVSGS